MDNYEIGKDIQALKEKIDRLEAMSSCIANSEKPLEETVEKAIPEGWRGVADEEIKTKTGILIAKTFNIDFRKRAANGESREGYITITSDGYYKGKINFRRNCPRVFCACNFSRARMELRNSSNDTIVAVNFIPSRFDLGRADDDDFPCEGWDRLIAENCDQMVFADPMFTSN
ncbi:MAG: hypothetical protein QUV06_05035 [Cyanobium sp. CZS 48M]|nr:hypothetical protein [Cyanobium sp. CZS48M]